MTAHFYLGSRMNNDFLTLDKRHPLGEIATECSRGFGSQAICLRNGTRLQAGMHPAGVIAHFSGPLSLLFLLVECSPRPRLACRRRPLRRHATCCAKPLLHPRQRTVKMHPCRVHTRLQAGTVSQANRMRFETPATPHICPTAVSRLN